MRIKSESAQAGVGTSRRVGDAFHNGFQDVLDADAGFRAGKDGLLGRDGEDVLQLPLGIFDISIREVDLVDDGDELQALLLGEVDIGHGLGLDALGGVDNQKSAFAGSQ